MYYIFHSPAAGVTSGDFLELAGNCKDKWYYKRLHCRSKQAIETV